MPGLPKWLRRERAGEELPMAPAQAASIVNVTNAAQAKLREVLGAANGSGPAAALRLMAETTPQGAPRYGMAVEESGEPQPGDAAVKVGGITILVDSASLPLVYGATVDFVDDPLRPGFKVDPPAPAAPDHGHDHDHDHAHGAATGSPPPAATLDPADPTTSAVLAVIEQQVNPGIASHGGRARLVAVQNEIAYVELGGGCQGCAMASVTLKQGVEQMIRRAVPAIREVVDVTDHRGGANPFYTSSKGGSSPFHQSSKG